MRQNSTPKLGKSTIKPTVAKSAQKIDLPDGVVKGMKSNNGIENAVSAVEGVERSEAILSIIYGDNIANAEERAYHSSGLAALDRRAAKDAREDALFRMSQSQKAAAGYAAGAAVAGGLGAAAAPLANLMAKNQNNNQAGEKDAHGKPQEETHFLKDPNTAVAKKGNSQGSEGKGENHDHSSSSPEMLAQADAEAWADQDTDVMDVTDPEGVFTG